MNATVLTFADEKAAIDTVKTSAPSQEFIERLECRLALLNEQIIKLSALAAKATDEEVQEKYWIAAQEASRQAREVREYLTKLSNTPSAQ